jgi:hypothetical protein
VSEMTRKVVALVALMTMLAVGVASGEDYGPCYAAYRQSGLTEQQMTFDQFHGFYGDTLCAPDGHDPFQAARQGRVLGETR